MSDKAEINDKSLRDERRRRVRDFREHVGMDLKAFAKLAKISYAMLSQFENGNRNLSEKAWGRVQGAIEKIYHRPGIAAKVDPSTLRQIVGSLTANVGYPVLTTKYDAQTRQELDDDLKFAKSILVAVGTHSGATERWLEAKIAACEAQKREMDFAEIARSNWDDYLRSEEIPWSLPGVLRDENGAAEFTGVEKSNPLEFPETMALLACDREDGKIIPWKPKKYSKAEPPGRDIEIRIANNPKEEAELLAAGWQLVKSE